MKIRDLDDAMRLLDGIEKLEYKSERERDEAIATAMEVLCRTDKSNHAALTCVMALVMCNCNDNDEIDPERVMIFIRNLLKVFYKGGIIDEGALVMKDGKVVIAEMHDITELTDDEATIH